MALNPKKTALIVIDVQNEYFDGDTEPQSEWPVVGARYELPEGVVF